jgi:hypothetical protein
LPSAKKGLPRIAQIYTDFFAFGKNKIATEALKHGNNRCSLL